MATFTTTLPPRTLHVGQKLPINVLQLMSDGTYTAPVTISALTEGTTLPIVWASSNKAVADITGVSYDTNSGSFVGVTVGSATATVTMTIGANSYVLSIALTVDSPTITAVGNFGADVGLPAYVRPPVTVAPLEPANAGLTG